MYGSKIILCIMISLCGGIRGQSTEALFNNKEDCLEAYTQMQKLLVEMEERFNQLVERKQTEMIEKLDKLKEEKAIEISTLDGRVKDLEEWKTQHENEEENTIIESSKQGYKEYFIGFLKNIDNTWGSNHLMISSKNATKVHIYSRQPPYNKTYNIEANGYLRIKDITMGSRVTSNNTVTQQGVLVNATADVWIQGGNVRPRTLDGFNVISTGKDSKEFVLISHFSKRYVHSGFVVVGTQDNTTVKIFKPLNYGGTVLISQIAVNQLDTYAWYEPEDKEVTGFKVISDKPISVYAGHQCGYVGSTSFCDHMVSSIPPIARLGTAYIIPPLAGVLGSTKYQLKVVATEANTNVTIFRDTVLYSITLHENQYINWTITPTDQPLNVRSSKPCFVAQLPHSNITFRSDTSMTVITPNSALSQSIRFGTLTPYDENSNFRNIYLIIVSVNQSTRNYQLNDKPLVTNWYPIPGWNVGSYYYSITKIQTGFYHLKTTSLEGGFTAYLQGFNSSSSNAEGFGYRLGLL